MVSEKFKIVILLWCLHDVRMSEKQLLKRDEEKVERECVFVCVWLYVRTLYVHCMYVCVCDREREREREGEREKKNTSQLF